LVKITDFGLSRLELESGEVLFNSKNPFSELFLPEKDLEKVAYEFSKLAAKVQWDADQGVSRSSWLTLKKRFRANAKIENLLRHPFFASLQERPSSKDNRRIATLESPSRIMPKPILIASGPTSLENPPSMVVSKSPSLASNTLMKPPPARVSTRLKAKRDQQSSNNLDFEAL
jgi:hypothetical protein